MLEVFLFLLNLYSSVYNTEINDEVVHFFLSWGLKT